MSFNLLPTSPSRAEKSSTSSIKHPWASCALLSPGLEHELNGSLVSASSKGGAASK